MRLKSQAILRGLISPNRVARRRRVGRPGGLPHWKNAVIGLVVVALTGSFLSATVPQDKPASQEAKRPGVDGNLVVTVGMSMIIDSPAAVLKLSIANGDLA